MSECIFCGIAARTAPARIVHENSDVICFLPVRLEVFGHTLIVPKRHYQDLFDIPADALAAVGEAGRELANAYRGTLGATGANLLHASGADAEQSVFHFHVHLMPRFPGDGFSTWPKLPKFDADPDAVHARLTAWRKDA